ncbi:stage III sporulation protein AB [Harryflintia acetispora]|uniref:Stage III sporulation protein AB n=1 Tax=Harryflintia acetispora TaxID=1849041 RepID=A0A9X8UJI8_9FIRM|nr:stage III sporulation protein AB [Harryflintia acetispora]TCL43542.1 stage III sporulation protein AB [Harryflintia acetispora]
MKLIGMVLVVLFCSSCGLMGAASLRRREGHLKKVQLFLHLLQERLSYTLSPLGEIFDGLRDEPLLRELDFISLCAGKLAGATPFPRAFVESLDESRCALDQRDRELLGELSSILGQSDLENQLRGIRLVRANMLQQAEAAEEVCRSRAKLYSSLGVLSGVAVAVVLL